MSNIRPVVGGAKGGGPGSSGPPGPKGDTGATGAAGATGPAGSGANPAAAVPITVTSNGFNTAYRAADPTKTAFLSVLVAADYTVTLAGTLADEVELRIGPTAASVTGATAESSRVATAKWSLTGIAVAVGLGMADRRQLTAMLPVGWYWTVRRINGTRATLDGAASQPLS